MRGTRRFGGGGGGGGGNAQTLIDLALPEFDEWPTPPLLNGSVADLSAGATSASLGRGRLVASPDPDIATFEGRMTILSGTAAGAASDPDVSGVLSMPLPYPANDAGFPVVKVGDGIIYSNDAGLTAAMPMMVVMLTGAGMGFPNCDEAIFGARGAPLSGVTTTVPNALTAGTLLAFIFDMDYEADIS